MLRPTTHPEVAMPVARSHAIITARLLIETVALLIASAWTAIAIAGQAAGTGAAAGDARDLSEARRARRPGTPPA